MLAKHDHYSLMDNGRVFTSLALMQLLLEPVAFLITALSGPMSAPGCFEHIRIYLSSETREAYKKLKHYQVARLCHFLIIENQTINTMGTPLNFQTGRRERYVLSPIWRIVDGIRRKIRSCETSISRSNGEN